MKCIGSNGGLANCNANTTPKLSLQKDALEAHKVKVISNLYIICGVSLLEKHI